MPTAKRIIDPSVFGPTDGWDLQQHTESIQFHGHTLKLQTSDGQTDDGKRGTFAVWMAGPRGTFRTHIEWQPIADVRDLAVAWAEKQLGIGVAFDPAADSTVQLEVAAIANDGEVTDG